MEKVENYYNRYDEAKGYEAWLIRDGYTSQGAEINEIQSAFMNRLKGVGDALFADGDIIRDAGVIVDKETGEVQAQSGAIYIRGAVRGVKPAVFTIPLSGTVAIGIRLTEKVISELDDPELYNPAVGSRGEGDPGAWRLQITAEWGFDGDRGSGEFFPVYTVDDGELRAKEAPPAVDSFTQSIARYDRDSTGGGTYVVSGLTVRRAEDASDGSQVYTVAEGRGRVFGQAVDLPTSRRLTYAAEPDLRFVDTEVHAATGAASQRLTVAHPPLRNVIAVKITAQKTASIIHGAYTGAADALPSTSVVSILKVQQGDTVFEPDTDYKKTGDTVNWTPAGNEPAPGSTYNVTYTCIQDAEPLGQDEDGFSVTDAVKGSSILISYNQMLPRLDRLCLNAEGRFIWLRGVAAELNPCAPVAPDNLLALAMVNQTWRAADLSSCVLNDAVCVVPFSDIVTINKQIAWLTQEVARNRLETDVSTRENGARAGVFVDPLLDDSMRDQGIAQTAAVVMGELTLPVIGRIASLSADVAAPASAPWTPKVMLEQPFRTGSMPVNPYMAFDPLPARVTLTPAVDRWTETETRWTSPITNRFNTGHFVPGRSWVISESTQVSAQQLDSTTTDLEYLRQIDVAFRGEGFGPGEELESITFDGLVIYQAAMDGGQPRSASDAGTTLPARPTERREASPLGESSSPYGDREQSESESPAGSGGERYAKDGLPLNIHATADPNGVLAGSFRVPAHVPAGAKTVEFIGRGGTKGGAVFVGQGKLTVNTMRQINTITTTWYDPLAQTFVPDHNAQLCGVDLWFTAKGGDARVQIREVQNGVPARTVLAEAYVPAASIVVTGGGHTRVMFDAPLSVTANTEYSFVVLCDDAVTALSVAELGKFDQYRQTWITSQPYQVGVLLSSSNASTWTAHQDRDLAFRLLEAEYALGTRTLDLGAATVRDATDMVLLTLEETPTAHTRVEYEMTLPTGEVCNVAAAQPLRFARGLSGGVRVKARLTSEPTASPTLWPGTQLLEGSVQGKADYYSRSIVARGASKAVLIYNAVLPSGSTVTPELQIDGGAWQAFNADGNTNHGDGRVEYRFHKPLSNAGEAKFRLTLTGTSSARPRVSDIRFLAVI